MKKTLLCFLFLFTTVFYAQDIVHCPGDNNFDLAKQKPLLIGNLNPDETTLSFHLNLADATNNVNAIANPSNYNASVGSTIIYVRIDNNGTITTNSFNIKVIAALNITATHTPILCAGDKASLTVTASAGIGQYLYSINGGPFSSNPTFNNLAAGVYTIQVLDTGTSCPTTVSYTITAPTILNATAMISAQMATITAIEGTAPYQYSLEGISYQPSPIFQNLTPGNHIFMVRDSNGCIATVQATVLPALTATAIITKEMDCSANSNASIAVAAAGGQAPYTYSLNGSPFQVNNNFSNLIPRTYSITVKDAVNTISNPTAITINPLVVLSATALVINPTNCSTGTITAIATGGKAPYIYSFDGGMTFISSNVFSTPNPGTYVIIVKDSKGCLSSSVTTTIQPTIPLVITASNTSILCNGAGNASLTINATGGKAPYQYAINNGAYTNSNTYTGLTAGTYTLKVRDVAGCISTIDHVINQPPVLTVLLATSGQNITLTSSGGTPPYQYSFDGGSYQTSNVFTVLTSGNYTFQAKDFNGCIRTFATSVVVPDPLTSSAILIKESDCMSGGSIVVNATGGQPPYAYSINGGASYQLNNTFTNIPAGTYTVKVKDISNTISNSNQVTVSPPVAVNATALITDLTDCSWGVITAIASGGKAPYVYSFDGGMTFKSSNVFSTPNPGTFVIIIRDSSGCLSPSITKILQPAQVLTVTAANTSILCAGETSSLTITATSGEAPFQYSINDGAYTTSNIFTKLKAGNYLIKVTDVNGCITALPYVIAEPEIVFGDFIIEGQTISVIDVSGGTGSYQYAIDNNVFQDNNVFTNVNPGYHRIRLKDSNNCEPVTFWATINDPNHIVPTATITKQIDCTNSAAEITINVSGGQAPYSYSIDGGVTFQPSNIFTNLNSGTYSIIVKDDINTFPETLSVLVNPFVAITATAVNNPIVCNGDSVSLTITASGGQVPYQYSLKDDIYTNSNEFVDVKAGTYTIKVKDAYGCIFNLPYVIQQPIKMIGKGVLEGKTASIINIRGGSGSYLYSLNDGPLQTNNVFPNLGGDFNYITVYDSLGCRGFSISFDMTGPAAITSQIAITKQIDCISNGTISIASSGGQAPYSYSIDGGTTYQDSTVFNNLGVGTYTIWVKDAAGIVNQNNSVTLLAPTPITATTAIKQATTCGENESVTITASGGKAPYSYSADGANYSSVNIFNGLSTGAHTLFVKDSNSCQVALSVTINSSLLNSTFTKTDPYCFQDNSGKIVIIANGGVTPYSYSLNNNGYVASNVFNNLAAGVYVINVKDAIGCTNSYYVSISQPNILSMTATVANSTTSADDNGKITVASSGGISPYTYALTDNSGLQISAFQTSPIFVGLKAGLYGVQVKDAFGCVFSKTNISILNNPNTLAVTTTATATTCVNSSGILTVTATGGTVPYQYSKDNGVTYVSSNVFNLTVGNYTIRVRDADGNTASVFAVINPPSNPSLSATVVSAILCKGENTGVITAYAIAGQAPYTYSFNGGAFSATNTFSNLRAGIFTITVRDINGCSATTVITLSEPAQSLSATAIAGDQSITVNAVGGTSPYKYFLQDKSGSVIAGPQSNGVFANLPLGMYTAQVTDANGCGYMQGSINVIPTAPLSSTADVIGVNCTETGKITINATGGIAPYQYSIDDGKSFVSTNVFSNLTAGVYAIKVRDTKNTVSLISTITSGISPSLSTVINSNILCKGSSTGSITLSIIGGKAPYQVSIDGGSYYSAVTSITYDILKAGKHTFDVKDSNGCSAVTSAILTEPADSLITGITVQNQTVTVEAFGGAGSYTFAISPDLDKFSSNNVFSQLNPGSYTVITSDLNQCKVTMNVFVDPPSPLINGQNKFVIELRPGLTLADIIVNGQNIRWYMSLNISDGSISKTKDTSLPLTTVLVDGTTYYASQTINGIESKERLAVTVKLNGSLSTPDFALSNFKYYPNPVLHNLTISNSSIIDEVEIFSVSGKSILSKKVNSEHSEIDLSNVSSGVYLLKVKSEGKTKTVKIVKK